MPSDRNEGSITKPMPRRMKSFSAEKRRRQDRIAFIVLSLLALTLGLWWCVPSFKSACQGALQAAWSLLFLIALRYLLRVVRGIRYDFFAIFDALVFVAAVVAIPICWFPKDVWHATIVLLCFVSTVWGISRFRFSPLFMFLNCLIAGAILL